MIAIITGGGRGIGAASAELLAMRGYDVLLTSRSHEELESTCRRIKQVAPKQRVEFFACDISDESAIKNLFSYCREKLGRISVLVNNAATIKVSPFKDFPISDWDRIYAVNVRATMLCSQEAFADMKGGSIINISSLGGIRSTEKFPGFVAYCTSKAAIVGFTESLAVEGRPLGIRVNCIAPGAVNTRMLAEAAPGLQATANPSDIARSVYYFADPALSSHITGSTLEIFSNA